MEFHEDEGVKRKYEQTAQWIGLLRGVYGDYRAGPCSDITGKIGAGSSPSQQKFETAVKDGKVTSAQIVQNKEVPTGSVVVQEQGGDSYTVNVTDVNAAISLLEDADVTYTVQNVRETAFS